MLPSSEMHAGKTQNGPFSPLTSPPETCISPSHCFLGYSPSTLKLWSPLLSFRCKMKWFFLCFFQRSAEAYLFYKITESTYYLVLNVYFGGSLLTKSCICSTISLPHTMSNRSTSNRSYLYFLSVGTSALLKASKTLLNTNIIKPNN